MAVRCNIIAVLLAATTLSPVLHAAEPSLEVSANRSTIYFGEPVVLTLKVSGLDNPRLSPDLSAITNCTVKLLGSRSDSHYSVVIANGKVTRNGFSGRIFTYEITPVSAGVFKAGPISLTIDGKTMTADGPTIQVTGIEPQELVAISIKPSTESVLVDEPFDITLSIMLKRLPSQFADAVPLDPNDPPALTAPFLEIAPIAGLDMPNMEKFLNEHLVNRGDIPGFAINNYTIRSDPMNIMNMFNINNPVTRAKFILDKQVVITNGNSYFEYTLKLNYTPREENSFTFGPLIFKGPVVTAVDQNGQGIKRQIFAVGPAATVRVVPPPEENRPHSYIGAIGSNILVEASIDTQTCKVGDPLKLTLSISGNIRLDNINPPLLDQQNNITRHFKIYEDTVHTSTRNGRKTFEYTIRPTTAGTLEFPPIEVSYFDSISRSYKTARTLPIPVRANETQEIGAANIIQAVTNQTSDTRTSSEQDALVVAPIDVSPSGAGPDGLTLRAWESVMLAGAPVFYLMIAVIGIMRRQLSRGHGSRRRRNSIREAISILQEFDQTAVKNPNLVTQLLCTAIRKYLANKFGALEAGITPTDAKKLLDDGKIDPATSAALCDILERNFNSAYSAGNSAPRNNGNDGRQALALINEIERVTKVMPGAGAGNSVRQINFFILAFSILSAPIFAAEAGITGERRPFENPVEFQFLWNEANARMSSAATPESFLSAASIYRKLVDAGVRNGVIFYNMGTALLKAKQYDAALESFHRAERYAGSNDDIRQNMLLAIASRDRNPTPALPWFRVPLFWHYRLSASTRIALAVCAFAGFWLALTMRSLGSKLMYRPLLSISLILLAVFGSSVATSIHQENRDARALIKITVVPEPSTSGHNPARLNNLQIMNGGKP